MEYHRGTKMNKKLNKYVLLKLFLMQENTTIYSIKMNKNLTFYFIFIYLFESDTKSIEKRKNTHNNNKKRKMEHLNYINN